MLRRGLTAAGLLVAAVALVAGGRAQPARTSNVIHVCGALDRQFIRAAVLSNTSIELLGQDYVVGDLSPSEALSQTRDAALGLRLTKPRDPSLKLTRSLLHGMVVEYGRAIRARWKGGDAGMHIFRSYSLANYAHDVLADAEPQLAKRGCPPGELLQQ
jgi:hypothetical protein